MTKRFEKAYNSLVKAYFEGTLAKGTCAACAVGNIIAEAQGGIISKIFAGGVCTTQNDYWSKLFVTTGGYQPRRDWESNQVEVVKILEETGYTWEEMAKVEFAFETNSKIYWWQYCEDNKQQVLEDQFNGLSAVVDVLVELDGIENDDKRYNKKFREHPKLVNA